MQNPRPRLARWLIKSQDLDFTVIYAHEDGPMLTAPDALNSFTFDASAILCKRFLEIEREIQEDGWDYKQ